MVREGDVAWQTRLWGKPVRLVLTKEGWVARHATTKAAAGLVRGQTRQVMSHAAQKG